MAPPPHDELLRELLSQVERRLVERVDNTTTVTSSAMADVTENTKTERAKNSRLFIGGGSAVITVVIAISGWVMDRLDAVELEQAAAIQRSKDLAALRINLRIVASRQALINKHQIETDRALRAGFEWLGKKLDLSHARAKRVPLPPRIEELGQAALNPVFQVSVEPVE